MNQETLHPDYTKGFNDGYLMAKHEPELMEKLIPSLNISERSQGLKDGMKQYEYERDKKHLPEWLRDDKVENPDRDDLEKDMDDLEKE